MSHEDLLKYEVSLVHISETHRTDKSRYSVLNREIIEVAIKLEPIQEEHDTPLVES